MLDKAILDPETKEVIPCISLEAWAKSCERKNFESNRRVAETTIFGGYWVSTVFLGLDHSFSWGDKKVKPLWFETMIFNHADKHYHNCHQWRYTTWDEAVEGHKKAVALVYSERSWLHRFWIGLNKVVWRNFWEKIDRKLTWRKMKKEMYRWRVDRMIMSGIANWKRMVANGEHLEVVPDDGIFKDKQTTNKS